MDIKPKRALWALVVVLVGVGVLGPDMSQVPARSVSTLTLFGVILAGAVFGLIPLGIMFEADQKFLNWLHGRRLDRECPGWRHRVRW